MLNPFNLNAKAHINILESDRQIVEKIHKAYAEELNVYISKRKQQILRATQAYCVNALRASPEIQSLAGGVLKGDFGLISNPGPAIIQSVSNSVVVKLTPVKASGKVFTGGITILIQPTDFSNLYALPDASQPIRGGSIPWLKWLLELGDTVIIADFGVEYGPFGRSGQARMTQKTRPFKVNSVYSGTSDDNFISRAFAVSENQLISELTKVIN